MGKLDIPVQLSAGIIEDDLLAKALRTSAARVVGAAAPDGLDWLQRVVSRFGGRVAVALDVQGKSLEPRGRERREVTSSKH